MLAKMNEVCSDSKDSALNLDSEHDMFINSTSSNENKSPPYKFKLPKPSTKQYPRKNRYLFQYRMGKSWLFDPTNSNNWLSNSTSDCDPYCIYNSIRMSSRSAKIMRALSSAHSSFRHDTIGIRKSLNFDSTPSPNENSSYDESSTSSISTDASSSMLNSSLTDSTDSNIPITSTESIDENQNRTPQQSRKHIKISSNGSDIKENICIRSRTLRLMALLERKRFDKNIDHEISPHPFCSFNPFTGSKGPSRIVTASTPRNLSREFNQEIDDRSHTPENMINIIPESISAIKRSHKKEKTCHEEQSSTQRADVSVKKDDLHPRTTESLKTNVIETNCNAALEDESPKKNKNIKRTLIYDECCNTRSDSEHNAQQKTMSTEDDSLGSELGTIESDKMEDIESNDCESHEEEMQASICFIDFNPEEESEENVNNEEVSQLSSQKELSGICNVSAISENRMASPESNQSISQDANEVVTPENHVNMLKHVLTESIKKSHKKMKHGNRKTLFKTEDFEKMELAKSETSIEGVCNISQNMKSQIADTIRVSNPQNSDRPSTPENVNSSRLLLLDFNSIKKSHKKDKRSKKSPGFAKCHDYECRKKSNNSLRRSRYEEENIGRTLHKNEFLGLKESPGLSPKKKKSTSVSLLSSTPKIPRTFTLGCTNINDEFKIFTPIKKLPVLLSVTDYVSTGEMLQKEDESPQVSSKEIDCFRCETPVRTHRFKELRKDEDITSERDNVERFETDTSNSKTADTANLKDENGRSTPINMSTTELLCNIDSIKKSHKKDKHSRSKKKRLYIEESDQPYVNFANNEKMLEEPTTSFSSKHRVDNLDAEKEMCSTMREKEKNKSYKETAYDDPQPSTSRGVDNMENARNITKSKFLNTTPPNNLSAKNLIKLLHTTSIKKSHKKERDINAQTKYILMSQEHELSDDGSIFDEDDRLNY